MCLSVPGRVLQREERGGTVVAQVDFRGVVREVCLALVPEAEPGDWVLVHLGMALDRLDGQAAREALAVAEQIGIPGRSAGEAGGAPSVAS